MSGGVLPAAPGYTGSIQETQSGNAGLSFVGGPTPTNLGPIVPQDHVISTNFTVLQQGLTADVNCSQIQTSTVTDSNAPVPISVFTGNSTYITAYAYTMACSEGRGERFALRCYYD